MPAAPKSPPHHAPRAGAAAMELAMPNVVDISPFCSYNSRSPCCSPNSSKNLGDFNPFSGIPEVLQAGDSCLDTPVVQEVPIQEIGSCRIEKIINDMVAAMRNCGASGLAAPQIGQALQIIVVEDPATDSFQKPPKSFNLLVLINPKLTVVNPDETVTALEDCPSICGYCALVNRYAEVEVNGLTRRGENIQVRAKGKLARLLQHECDHLEGILFVDKMVPKSFRRIF